MGLCSALKVEIKNFVTSKMAAAAIFKFRKEEITHQRQHTSLPNLSQKLGVGLHIAQKVEIHNFVKSKMAAAAIVNFRKRPKNLL